MKLEMLEETDPGEGPAPPPLSLDQTEKKILRPPPSLVHGLE